MKYLIASDIHGSAHFCRLLKERFEEENADLLILLGDLLYHGARNALPQEYSTLETAEILNSMKDDLVCVRGNCDSEVDELVLEFPIGAEYCVLPYAGRRLFLTHGHKTPKHLKKGTSMCPPLKSAKTAPTSIAARSPSPKKIPRTPISSLKRACSSGRTWRREKSSCAPRCEAAAAPFCEILDNHSLFFPYPS